MKSSLSKGQERIAHSVDERLAETILNLHGSSAEILCNEFVEICTLMAMHKFTVEKCRDYTRSGSRTCMACRWHYDLRTIEESKREGVMSAVKICAKCELERNLVAKGKCQRCNYGDWKDISKEDLLEMIKNGTVQIRGKSSESKQLPLPSQQQQPAPAVTAEEKKKQELDKTPTAYSLKIFAPEDDDLFMQIEELAFKNKREPEHEILVLLHSAVKNAKTTSVPIPKLLKVMESCKNYPVPSGSPREVFAATIDMMAVRIKEFAEV